MTATPRVPVIDLRHLVRDLFTAAGVQVQAATEVAEALVRADQEGQPSHGVMMVDLYLQRIAGGSVSTRTSGEIVSDRAATAVIDAHDALGQLTARQAIDLACAKADAYGIGIVTVRNAFHFGTASRYTERAAQRGKVGIAMSNTRPLMPAPGGSERLVGNNPIGFALPTATGRPLSFDMATSQAAMGKIRLAQAEGSTIPLDWATDAPKEIVIVVPEGRGAMTTSARPLLDVLQRRFVPNSVLVVATEADIDGELGRRLPWVRDKRTREGRATAYVCERGACQLPTSDPQTLARQLSQSRPYR